MEGRMGGRKEDETTAGRGFDSQPGSFKCAVCMCLHGCSPGTSSLSPRTCNIGPTDSRCECEWLLVSAWPRSSHLKTAATGPIHDKMDAWTESCSNEVH